MVKHTPYAEGASPFAIGLTPLDLANWIEVDDHLHQYLNEKQRLMHEMPGEVFAADYASEAAQEEVLSLVVEHLLSQFPDIYSLEGNVISIAGTDHKVNLDDFSVPPLLQAALLIQEDLALLRKEGHAWHLVAASVCFPSSWILREKIGKPMHGVHAPVPGYQEGTRNAGMLERIFDNMQVELPVERFNWSIYTNDGLFQGGKSNDHIIDEPGDADEYFIRVEHQTLRKLPKTDHILFTIRIHIDPVSMLEKRADASELTHNFIDTINGMKAEQVFYKGLEMGKHALIERLREIAS